MGVSLPPIRFLEICHNFFINISDNHMLRILFVDDAPDETYLFNEALEHCTLPISLSQVHNGIGLINELATGKLPDLILMDINMPYKNGIEALKDIKSNCLFKKVFVIMYSITADKALIKKAYDKGADLYLVKPDDFEGMLSVVKKLYSINWAQFERPAREHFLLQI